MRKAQAEALQAKWIQRVDPAPCALAIPDMMDWKDAKLVAVTTPPVLPLARAEKLIIAEWHGWAKKRGSTTIIDMQIFYFVWLTMTRPDLLAFKCRGDQWQVVSAWLQHDEDLQVKLRMFPGVALE